MQHDLLNQMRSIDDGEANELQNGNERGYYAFSVTNSCNHFVSTDSSIVYVGWITEILLTFVCVLIEKIF